MDVGLIDREYYRIPESVRKQLKGKLFFSRLDLKNH